MSEPLKQALVDAMRVVADKKWKAGVPGCYRWSSVWWHLQSKWERLAGFSDEVALRSIEYSRNQLLLYRDMRDYPEHYARKPEYINGNTVTDWQWMQKRT